MSLGKTASFLRFTDYTVEILSSSDIFLLPSASAGRSISPIDAVTPGLPILATWSGGQEEIVKPNVDVYLIPPTSGSAIAAVLRALAASPHEPRRLGGAGEERVASRSSLTAMIQGYGDLHREVVGA